MEGGRARQVTTKSGNCNRNRRQCRSICTCNTWQVLILVPSIELARQEKGSNSCKLSIQDKALIFFPSSSSGRSSQTPS